VPSPSNPPSGCRFHPRCPYAVAECRRVHPELDPMPGDPRRRVACIRKGEI
jgi:oligopeptide/dipeptide ABC transporter ATP-binding protein